MKKLLILMFCFAAATSWAAVGGCDGSGNCYVLAGANGSNSGSDWTNAFNDLPANLTRGVTYYVGTGTYGSHNFGDADSGTTPITIQAATTSAHGPATGWNSSYQGVATFTCANSCASVINFTSDYWVFNGVYRSDWTTGYGFHVSNVNGNAGTAVTQIGSDGGPYYHNITVHYVDSEGSHPTSDSSPGVGAYTIMSAGGSYNILIDHVYSHDGYTSYYIRGNHGHSGGGSGYGPGNNITIQYSYSKHAYDSANYHGEACSCSEGLQNFTIRYSYFVDPVNSNGGTAYIATASGAGYNSGNQSNGPWYIYGNVFKGQVQSPTSCAVGDATLDWFDISFNPGGDLWVVQNTYANVGPNYCRGGASGYAFGSGWHAQMSNVTVENEVWYNSSGFGDGANGGTFTYTTFTSDYNQYYEMADSSSSADPGAHSVVTASSNPFVNVAAFDFTLASGTAAGSTLTNAGTYWNGSATVANTFNVDMNGNLRGADGVWDRGAFEFSSQGTISPPTNLKAVVN